MIRDRAYPFEALHNKIDQDRLDPHHLDETTIAGMATEMIERSAQTEDQILLTELLLCRPHLLLREMRPPLPSLDERHVVMPDRQLICLMADLSKKHPTDHPHERNVQQKQSHHQVQGVAQQILKLEILSLLHPLELRRQIDSLLQALLDDTREIIRMPIQLCHRQIQTLRESILIA